MKRIFISEGDPSGINYELISKLEKQFRSYGKNNQIILVQSQNQVQPDFFQPVLETQIPDKPGLFMLCQPLPDQVSIKPGAPSAFSGKVSYQSFTQAIKLQKQFGGDLVTLPLSKEWIMRSGVRVFSGHTETLAKLYRKDTFMLMAGKRLNVIPLTTHVPLARVKNSLAKVKIKKLVASVLNYFGKDVNIGLLGLNPHAGEGGKIGREELEILETFRKEFIRSGLEISKPLPADSAFIGDSWKKYSLFLSCYHDQGLIPFKMIEDKNGINVTLGLDFIRVSPDHGPAYEIAGKGIADPGSLLQCLKVVCGK